MIFVYVDRYISPFEGSPRAGAAEYVYGGDVFIIRELGAQPLTLIENILTIKNIFNHLIDKSSN